ncbi:Transcription factor tau subunit sfc15 / FY16936)) [Taphrina deformans PYCC 5710]|uniref:Transcription factor tau subunit sfc15 / FY16936 n=1 Tax=Taphrina deformans (strain PYCC 5710 / ATCC 11124 / CBS 356.35 / IMI 108563 / JCM 9778 / NBRC 8474) TaxID=1097556 RepID=R4X8G8_TAPDE|nr:Transcription factor tau subunit sfc15 / FY16936)) [Taphrina deformans PYCC 5710]|eukprot:CCG81899.1 Transcription factor tau subunit sfc15 / FY16936)) [Taphrina deformans PYCC 5710]
MEYRCPTQTLLSIIHPGLVQDVERAIETIGGPQAMRKVADDPVTSVLELRFRPKDRFEHPIASCTAKVSNLLIKVQKEVTEKGIVRVQHEPIAAIKYSIRFRGM